MSPLPTRAITISPSPTPGAVTSSVVTLTVMVPPLILTQPQSQTVIASTPASFSSAATGTAPLSIQWYCGAVALAGATNSTLAWASVAATNAGNYHLTVSNAARRGHQFRRHVDRDGSPFDPHPAAISNGDCHHAGVVLFRATGTAPLSIQWSAERWPWREQPTAPWPGPVSPRPMPAITTSRCPTLRRGHQFRRHVDRDRSPFDPHPAAISNGDCHDGGVVLLLRPARRRCPSNGHCGAVALAGATNSTLAWASVAATNAGNYYLTVSNVAGAVTSSVVTLTVMVPPSIRTQPQSQTVIATTAAWFLPPATGTAPLSIQWYCGATALAGATNSNLAWASVAATNAGNYHLTVSNAAGAVTSSVATLTVLPTNTIATAAGAITVCFSKPTPMARRRDREHCGASWQLRCGRQRRLQRQGLSRRNVLLVGGSV